MSEELKPSSRDQAPDDEQAKKSDAQTGPNKQAERPEPTRYGDWEKDGRCIDF